MQYLFGMHPVLEAVKAGKKFDKASYLDWFEKRHEINSGGF